MTKFEGGPADSVVLALQRLPIFLRAVRGPSAKDRWDALDQPGDTPDAREEAFAYRRVGAPGPPMRIQLATTRGRRCLSLRMATYRYVEPQPPRAVLRDEAQWQAWVLGVLEREKSEHFS